jgi:hypothetical protein
MWHLSTFLLFLAALCLAESISLGRSAVNDALSTTTALDRRSLPGARVPRSAATKHTLGEADEDITLLDIVLVASVDGKFHAVSRTSGQKLWSMSAGKRDIPSSLAPLVRTKHATLDPDLTDDDDAHQELYIIEPQTGDIYVMATPTSPLQPLSFSMSQLVEISPFKFAREDDERIFVGKKETSLLSIELETGKVKVINAECPWDPFEDFSSKEELDLDELEDHFAKKDQLGPTEVFIGRTGELCNYSEGTQFQNQRKITTSPSTLAPTRLRDGSRPFRPSRIYLSRHMGLTCRTMPYKLPTDAPPTTPTSNLSRMVKSSHSKPETMTQSTRICAESPKSYGHCPLTIQCRHLFLGLLRGST